MAEKLLVRVVPEDFVYTKSGYLETEVRWEKGSVVVRDYLFEGYRRIVVETRVSGSSSVSRIL